MGGNGRKPADPRTVKFDLPISLKTAELNGPIGTVSMQHGSAVQQALAGRTSIPPEPDKPVPVVWVQMEETMLKLATAILLLSAPALAQTAAVDCPPIGQSAKGELIYGMDCKALKPENRAEVLPNVPSTNMKDTVIPKSGKEQTPETTPTTGVNK